MTSMYYHAWPLRACLHSWPSCLSRPRARMIGRCHNIWPSLVFWVLFLTENIYIYIRKASSVGTVGLVCHGRICFSLEEVICSLLKLVFCILGILGWVKGKWTLVLEDGARDQIDCVVCPMTSLHATYRPENKRGGRSWGTLGHHFLVIMERVPCRCLLPG